MNVSVFVLLGFAVWLTLFGKHWCLSLVAFAITAA
jgi:hypothetical protein